jgi:hypothetical protein
VSASKFDLDIDQGADFEANLELVNLETSQALNITGWTFAAQIRDRYDSPRIAATFTVSITVAASGTLKMSLTNAQTATLNPSIKYVYDLEATRADSKKLRIIHGICNISPEVTK